MKRLSLVLVFVFLAAFFPVSVFAEGVSYEIDSTYQANDKTVDVTHDITFSSETSLGQQELKLPGTADELSITSDGASLEFTNKTGQATGNKVPYIASVVSFDLGESTDVKIQVNYSADDLLANYVQSSSVIIPPFDVTGEITSQSIELSAPLEGIGGTLIGIEPTDTTTTGGEQTYIFNQDGPITTPIILQEGIGASAKVEVNASLENDGFWWQTKSIVLPLDTNQQNSYLESIEPKPSRVKVDQDGNIIAEYRLRPFKKIDVKAVSSVIMEHKSYDVEAEGGFQQITADIVADYTGNTELWPESFFKGLDLSANKLRSETVIEATRQIFDAVVAESDDFETEFNYNDRIADTKQEPKNSLERSDKLTAALRGAGIPARLVGGVITNNQQTVLPKPQDHVWVEAYIPEVGWMTLDPTYGEFGPEYFAQAGLEKVALFIWGVSDHIPEFTNTDVVVTYNESEFSEEEFTNSAISGQNFILLPGVSILRSVASMPPGLIHDEVTVTSGGNEQEFGSLAPLQQIQRFQLKTGQDSWSSSKLKLNVAGEAAASSTANVNYIPAIIEVVVLIIGGWFVIQWRKKRNAPVVLADDDSDEYEIEGQDLLNVAKRDSESDKSQQ